MSYKLLPDGIFGPSNSVFNVETGFIVPKEDKKYVEWLLAGNEPLPADPKPELPSE